MMSQEWTDEDEGVLRAIWLRNRLNSGLDLCARDRDDWPSFLLVGEQLYWSGWYVMWRNYATAEELRHRQVSQWRREDDKEFIWIIHNFTDTGSWLTLPFTWALVGIYWIFRTLFRLLSGHRKHRDHRPICNDYSFHVEGTLYVTNYRIVDGHLGAERAPTHHYKGPLHLSMAILQDIKLVNLNHILLQSGFRTVSISAGPVWTPELYVYLKFLKSESRYPLFGIPEGFYDRAQLAGKLIPPDFGPNARA